MSQITILFKKGGKKTEGFVSGWYSCLLLGETQ